MSDAETHRRPAEALLVTELRDQRDALLDGFDDRRAVLRWLQKLTVRTLGQVPTKRYEEIAEEFRPDGDYLEGPLLSAFLTGDARVRPLSDAVARETRTRWAADTLGSTQVWAFRSLRKDAGNYVGETANEDWEDTPGYDPEKQTSFIMRPSLERLDRDQRYALNRGLDGLDSAADILDWGDDITKATRGEAVDPGRGAGEFIPKLYREKSAVRLLTSDEPQYQRARQAFLARWLLPAFNRAVQDLQSRAAEEPDEEREDTRTVKPA